MIRDPRRQHYHRLAMALAGSTLIGWYFGFPWLFLALAALAYLLWILIQQHKLIAWLLEGAKETPPEGIGLWAVVFDHLYKVQRNHQQQIKQYRDVVNRIRLSTEALAEGILMLDNHGNIQWWNSSAKEILQLRTADLGQALTNLLRDPLFIEYYHNNNASEPLTLDNPANESQRLQISITHFGQGERLVLVQDVTRLHNLELMRQDFVANASHELKTPLTVLRGHLENILMFAEDLRPPIAKAMQSMATQTVRMTNLVEDLLLLARLDSAESSRTSKEINMQELLRQAVEDGRTLSADKDHRFVIDCQSNARLRGNLSEIRSVVTNLLFNAVNYSPAGSEITLSWHQQGRGHCLTVADQGIGIEAHHIARLTERFYRVDSGRSSRTGGTGLGLAIVKHALQRHQAKLLIESQFNKGSQFSCLFPEQRIHHNDQATHELPQQND